MSRTITRGEGITPSERRLAALADKTFLRLWSYPNTFNDRAKHANGVGQEFADLLAVFENHVVLFSDKEINWQTDKPLTLAWCRWYRRAVLGAVGQLVGAERWLDLYPDRIFIDKKCHQRFPIPLPPKNCRILHLVAVVGGATEATRRYFGHPRGTFIIRPDVKGDMHTKLEPNRLCAFVIGDVNPGGVFVHVFDRVSFEFVMQELDTVGDFTSYLVERAKKLRSGELLIAGGEDDLLSAYMMNGFIEGWPGFVPRKLRAKAWRKKLVVPEGEYETYVSSPCYERLRILRRHSMLWDEVIEVFSGSALLGVSVSILDQVPSLELSENVLRIMASEKRMDRVVLAEALRSSMRRSLDEKFSRFIRRVIISRRQPDRKIGYVFVIFSWDKTKWSYDDYRQYRSSMLLTYVLSFCREQGRLNKVVGIALDIYREEAEIKTRSEDMVAMEVPNWTPEMLADLGARRLHFALKEPRDLKVTATKHRIKSPFRVVVSTSGRSGRSPNGRF